MRACGLGLKLLVLGLGLAFVKEKLACLLVLAARRGDPLKGVWI